VVVLAVAPIVVQGLFFGEVLAASVVALEAEDQAASVEAAPGVVASVVLVAVALAVVVQVVAGK
jgi:hypothetical protein